MVGGQAEGGMDLNSKKAGEGRTGPRWSRPDAAVPGGGRRFTWSWRAMQCGSRWPVGWRNAEPKAGLPFSQTPRPSLEFVPNLRIRIYVPRYSSKYLYQCLGQVRSLHRRRYMLRTM